MREIKTKIDDVFDFVQKRKKTTLREVSNELNINRDELETYVYLLNKKGLIVVKYNLTNTYLYAGEMAIAESF